MKFRGKLLVSVLLCAALGSSVRALLAADPAQGSRPAFPSKPVHIVVGFSPGGLPDISARLIAQKLSEGWNQQVLVENRPGAGGNIGAEFVAKSNPDGHTILSTTSALAASPALYANLAFDPAKDFAGVTVLGSTPMLLVAAPSKGMKSVKDVIALAKAHPGQLNFASAGVGSNTHFAMEVFNSAASVDIVHVAYKGIPEALTDVMTGRVQLFMAPLGNALTPVKDGKVLALGVTSKQRASVLPDVPTVLESGVPYSWEAWFGLLVPANTPRAIVANLDSEITRVLTIPDVRGRLAGLGAETPAGTPEQFDRILRDDIATFATAAKAARIKPQ